MFQKLYYSFEKFSSKYRIIIIKALFLIFSYVLDSVFLQIAKLQDFSNCG